MGDVPVSPDMGTSRTRAYDSAAPRVRLPLAVDLDGTLVLSDTLHEGFIGFVKARPHATLTLYPTFRQGKAAFKRHVAANVDFDPALLPYNAALLEFLQAEKQAGRCIGLFTAADQSIADAVAAHLGLFDVVRGSDAVTNLSGEAKAAAIEDEFGPDFAYAGDGKVDGPIFRRARSVILVGPVERLRAGLAGDAMVEATFPSRRAGVSTWAKALRLQHWVKNTLVFVAPVLASPAISSLLQAALLFVLLGIVASATYVINDLLDLASDRRHPHKRFRPFATGTIPARDGVLIAGLMIAGALLLSLFLPRGCTIVLAAYLAITLSYSLVLKRMPMVDVMVLAGLFTLRVLAGSLLVPTPISPWLLTFSMLFFLGLAIIKRYAELDRVVRAVPIGSSARGYTREDLPILLASGVAAGFSAVVIFMIYLIDDQYPRTIYSNPAALWGIMPVILIWTLRLWHLAVHGRMSEDPVIFALKDRTSLALGAFIAVILVAAHL